MKHHYVIMAFLGCLTMPILAFEISPQLKVKTTLMLDYDQYGAFFNKENNAHQNHHELRRAKLSMGYRSANDWQTKLQLDYTAEEKGNDGGALGDAYIGYTGFRWVNIQLGRMKEPFSFEKQTGLAKNTTIERSISTSAFSPGRSYGIKLSQTKNAYTWSAGVFREDTEKESPESLSARVTWAPFKGRSYNLHLGTSMTKRNLKGELFQIKERAEINSADNIVRSAKYYAESIDVLQLESAFLYHSSRLQAEWVTAKVEQENGGTWHYDGQYVQASYLFQGFHYQYKKGRITTPRVSSSYGSWELVTRVSRLNLRDNQLGSKTLLGLVGINYYVNNNLRLMGNLVFPEISGNTVNDDQSGTALSFRAQYVF